jgi:O-antigen ligase
VTNVGLALPTNKLHPARYSAVAWLAVVLPAVALSVLLLDSLWYSVPVLAIALLLAAAGPSALIGLMLVASGFSLSVLLPERTLFEMAGGANLDGLRLLVVLLGTAILVLTKPSMPRESKLVLGLLPFVVWCGLTIWWSPARGEGLRLLFKLAYPFAVFIILGMVLPARAAPLAKRMLIVGVLLGCVTNLLAAAVTLSEGADFKGRYWGTVHPNTIGMYSAMAGLGFYSWWRATRNRLYLAVLLSLLIQLLATGSRTSLISGAVGVATIEMLNRKPGRVAILSTVLAAAWLFVPAFGQRTTLVDPAGGLLDRVNLSGRLLLWGDVWTGMVQGAEPWGRGLGSTIQYLEGRYGLIRGVHNIYLQLLAETGLVGLSLFVLGGAFTVFQLVRLRKVARMEMQLALAGMVCFAVAGIADNVLGDYASFTVFPFLYAGLAAATAVPEVA